MCSDISDKCHRNFNPNNELLRQLQDMLQFIDIFNSAFSNCSHVFQKNPSVSSGYYTLKAVNGSLIYVYCDDNAFDTALKSSKKTVQLCLGTTQYELLMVLLYQSIVIRRVVTVMIREDE